MIKRYGMYVWTVETPLHNLQVRTVMCTDADQLATARYFVYNLDDPQEACVFIIKDMPLMKKALRMFDQDIPVETVKGYLEL
ncbi:MAG: hypothetical protein KJO69_01565 [Gammaproteobacteria bacterium]|nr:hypothetical protein [Gammaproteobacteria bacterium]